MISGKYCFCLVMLAVCLVIRDSVDAAGPLSLIKELLQNNVAGEPLIHMSTQWEFDPDIAEKRRILFYEKNGFRANKFIERIGVGVDGKEEERRIAQAVRDQGRLNGEHVINYP